MKFDEMLESVRADQLNNQLPGTQALVGIQQEEAAKKQEAADAEASRVWGKLPDAGGALWGKQDYNYTGAYCAGVSLESGALPNRYFKPNAVNIGGYDMATGNPVKPVVLREHEGVAYHGAQQISRSRTKMVGPGIERPTEDIIGLSAMAAAYQASGRPQEEFSNTFGDWGDKVLQRAWQAGTDSLRFQELPEGYRNSLLIGAYAPQPTSLDFTVRMADKEFQTAGRQIYKHFWGTEFKGSDVEASHWLASHMRDLDLNTPMFMAIMLKGKNGTPESWAAYTKAIEAWDLTNMERSFLPQLGNMARIVGDPVNWVGGSIGKLTLVSAQRAAAKDLFKRLAAGAAIGVPQGAAQATVKASVQGRNPTGGELAAGAGFGAAGTGGGNVVGAELEAALKKAYQATARGIKKFTDSKYPAIPRDNVQPARAAPPAAPVEPEARPTSDPTMEEAEAGNLTTAEGRPINLEQQPYEGPPGWTEPGGGPGFAEAQRARDMQAAEGAGIGAPLTEGQADEMLGGPSVAGVQAGEQAAAALPPSARPPVPLDPASRVLIDPATGYYSPVQRIVAESQHAAQQPGQWLADIKKAPFLKQDELEWLELDKFFEGKDKVTKEELLAHLDDNMVKIQRYPLVAQRRDTVPWEVAVERNNPEYAQLRLEHEALNNEAAVLAGEHHTRSIHVERMTNDLDEITRKTADITPDDPRYENLQLDLEERRQDLARAVADRDMIEVSAQSERMTEIRAHMRRIAGEERKALMASGDRPPPWVHDIEWMLTERNTGVADETRDALVNLYVYLDSIKIHQDLLTRARSSAVKAQLQARIAADEQLIKATWQQIEDLAANTGALVHPDDVARMHGMVQYGDPGVRDISTLGSWLPSAKRTRAGVDPLGHQVTIYRHPEGLLAQGTSGHPGGESTGTLGWAITSERTLADGKQGTLVDEGQADMVKERKKGEKQYKELKPAVDADPTLDFDSSDALRKSQDYDDYVWQIYRDSFNQTKPVEKRRFDRLPEHWADATPAQRAAMSRAKDVWSLDTPEAESVPAMPKQIFSATAMSNIFKSELYNAAANGRDWFGWSSSRIVQERWGKTSQEIEGNVLFEPYHDRLRVSDDAGNRRVIDITEAYEWADRIGGDDGAALRKMAHEMERLAQGDRGSNPVDVGMHFDKPFVMKAGSFMAYDVKIRKEMQKLVEKYGGKVTLEDMPIAPGAKETAKIWVIRMDGPMRQKLLARGVPIGAAAGAAVAAGQAQEEMQ